MVLMVEVKAEKVKGWCFPPLSSPLHQLVSFLFQIVNVSGFGESGGMERQLADEARAWRGS